MAWAPSTNFEDDLVELQPDFNLIHGQWTYEATRSRDYTPRPKSTYEYLARQEKRNKQIEKSQEYVSKTKEISDSLAMMQSIQEIAGTKKLGEHATLADWDDESTVEMEAVAMMRHFGMMSMAGGTLAPTTTDTLPQGKIQILRNGKKSFPYVLDPSYFEPGRKRQTSKANKKQTTRESSRSPNSNAFDSAESGDIDSSYSTARTHLDDSISSKDSFVDIPYELLQTSSEETEPEPKAQQYSLPKETKMNTNNGRRRRPSQKQRKIQQN
ncbi:uncharacterized protein LOC117794491 isoform X2 [Drosophila innubila]|uniref:uncharacterized protein LOC117794491 isoform X2 n=1 Tax=Drosophila innubila TaxID=198719 RepID=UPI00148DB950|nr:uncharacterized protein LOC117794491 isoform X2 [Drosophila innubila]XP_034491004.1 uncharacterized protein LOC117794491 isoform X2 [Drosophila innubila]